MNVFAKCTIKNLKIKLTIKKSINTLTLVLDFDIKIYIIDVRK